LLAGLLRRGIGALRGPWRLRTVAGWAVEIKQKSRKSTRTDVRKKSRIGRDEITLIIIPTLQARRSDDRRGGKKAAKYYGTPRKIRAAYLWKWKGADTTTFSFMRKHPAIRLPNFTGSMGAIRSKSRTD